MPYILTVVEQICACMKFYKGNSLLSLFDLTCYLCEYLQTQLQDPQIENLLVPALVSKWTELDDLQRMAMFEAVGLVAMYTKFG